MEVSASRFDECQFKTRFRFCGLKIETRVNIANTTRFSTNFVRRNGILDSVIITINYPTVNGVEHILSFLLRDVCRMYSGGRTMCTMCRSSRVSCNAMIISIAEEVQNKISEVIK